MTSAWELLFLLLVPGLLGLVVLMHWLERYLTYQLAADDVAVAWQSTESAEDLEEEVRRILGPVVVSSR